MSRTHSGILFSFQRDLPAGCSLGTPPGGLSTGLQSGSIWRLIVERIRADNAEAELIGSAIGELMQPIHHVVLTTIECPHKP
jgi:hypothetical protein